MLYSELEQIKKKKKKKKRRRRKTKKKESVSHDKLTLSDKRG